jgi:hypothetical protein
MPGPGLDDDDRTCGGDGSHDRVLCRRQQSIPSMHRASTLAGVFGRRGSRGHWRVIRTWVPRVWPDPIPAKRLLAGWIRRHLGCIHPSRRGRGSNELAGLLFWSVAADRWSRAGRCLRNRKSMCLLRSNSFLSRNCLECGLCRLMDGTVYLSHEDATPLG